MRQDDNPDIRLTVWRQADRAWRLKAVIGLIALLLISSFYLYLLLSGAKIPIDIHASPASMIFLFIGLFWWMMITKGGTAARVWQLMWMIFLVLILLSVSLRSAISIILLLITILMLPSQVSVAQIAAAIGAGEQAAETKEQAAPSEEQEQIEALNRLKPWFYIASGAVIGAFPGALLFIVMAAQPIDKNTCMGPIAFWIPAILEFLGFIIGSLVGVIIGMAVSNQWKSSKAWLGLIAVLVGGFFIGPGIFIAIYLPYSLLFPDPKTYLMPAIFFHLLCAAGVFAMPLIFKSRIRRGSRF